MNDASAPAEVAYYYPQPYWLAQEGGWIKSLLLFFDEVAILLPEYMRERPAAADVSLVEPLEDQGLLRVLEPEWFVDEEMTTNLTDIIQALIERGAFDGLSEVEHLAELSMSRMGFGALEEVAGRVYRELERRGLAKESEDGVSIPMHPVVRSMYLVVLAQLARDTGARHDLDLHPVTNGRGASAAFGRLLELEPMPSRGQVVAFDVDEVSVDLDQVPLPDVLAFRTEHREAHRLYMQNLRSFALELSLASEADRVRSLDDRRTELRHEAEDLHRAAISAFKTKKDIASFGLGLTGAAWAVAAESLVPAILSALGAGLKVLPDKAEGSAYSYLFEAKRKLR